MAKKHFVHVNQNVLRGNQKHGKTDPAITVKSGSKNRYGYGALTQGRVEIVYGGNGDPLIRCGARVAIIADKEPEVIEAPVPVPQKGTWIRINGPRIQANLRRLELMPVVEIREGGGEVLECYGAIIEGQVIVCQSTEEGNQHISIIVDGEVTPVTTPPKFIEFNCEIA